MEVTATDPVDRNAEAPDEGRPTSSGDNSRGRHKLAPIDRLLIVAGILGGVAILVAFAHWAALGWPFPAAAVGAIAALSLCAELTSMSVAIGARRFRTSFGEASLIVGLVFIPLPLLVLVNAASTLTEQTVRGLDWRRKLFNTAGTALTVYAAVIVFSVLNAAFGGKPGSPSSWPWLALSVFVAALLNKGWVAAAISASTGSSWISVAKSAMGSHFLEYCANLIAALLIICGWRYSRQILFVLPFLLIVIWQQHKRQLDKTTETDALRRLAAASAAMPGLSLVDMTDEVRTRAADLFGARGVQLRLGTPAGDETPNEPRATLTPGGVEVTLLGHDGHLGNLVLDVEQSGGLTRQEQDVLITFANTTAAALETVLAHAEQLHAAQHDILTGLPNRALLGEYADRTLAAAVAGGNRFAMIMLDLDGFKNVNDTLGHAAGDRLLVEIGARLAGSVRTSDCVARLGGDEFVVLLDHLENDLDGSTLAATLVERISVPVTIDGLRLAVEASAGVAIYPDDGPTVDSLLRCADVAMYEAKRRGRQRGALQHLPGPGQP